MALDLGTVLSVVEVVQKAIQIYERIDSLPDQMEQLGTQMETLGDILALFEGFVRRQSAAVSPKPVVAPGPDPVEVSQRTLGRIKIKAEKINDLFERYEKGILSRSMDLEFRARWVSKLWFSIVEDSPAKIQAIIDEIERETKNLDRCFQFMVDNARHVQELAPASAQAATPVYLPAASQSKKGGQKKQNQKSPTPATAALTAPAAAEQKTTPVSTAAALTKPPQLPQSRSPIPRHTPKNVLFVDLYNTDRSVVAEALLKLLGHLTCTLKSPSHWPVAAVHSAGFFVRAHGDCAAAIDSLDYTFQSFRKGWTPGGESPAATGLAAVFENKWMAQYPFKKKVREEMEGRRSVGLRKDLFREWDFIVVFTRREESNLGKLKKALEGGKEGNAAAAAGKKGKVVQLGSYLPPVGGMAREILYVKDTGDARKDRANWNMKVAEIKSALKAFLRRELGWVQPEDTPVGGTGQGAV
ncbi:hypothetical protein VTI74DRAFT_8943 [Chaetomium olivicolor]